nr:M(II)ELC-like protein [Parasacculina yatsui]
MTTFSDSQIVEFQETFSIFDMKGDSKIATSQIGDVVRALGQNPTEADVKRLCQSKNSDDRLTFEEFLPVLQTISRQKPVDTAEDFIEGLRHFDKDGNGYISAAEIRSLMTTLGEKMTEEEVEQLLAGMEDSQGNVNYEELVRSVLNG